MLLDIEYCPGKTNTNADLLYQYAPRSGNTEDCEGISLPGVNLALRTVETDS